MLAWGILIYNRNSVKDKIMFKIQRSKSNVISKLRDKKMEIINNYFLRSANIK